MIPDSVKQQVMETIETVEYFLKVLETLAPDDTFADIFRWATKTGHPVPASRRKWIWKKIKKHNLDNKKALEVLRRQSEKLLALFQEGSRKYVRDLFHLLDDYCSQVIEDTFLTIMKEALEEYGITDFTFTDQGVSLPGDLETDRELLAALEELVKEKFVITGLDKILEKEGFLKIKESPAKVEATEIKALSPAKVEANYGLGKLPTIGQICATKNWDSKLLAKKYNDFRLTETARNLFESHNKIIPKKITFPGEKSRTSAANWITGKNNPVGLQREFLEHILQCEFGVHQVLVDQHSPTKFSVSKTAEIKEMIAAKVETVEHSAPIQAPLPIFKLEEKEWAELLLGALVKKTGLTVEESVMGLVIKELGIPDHVVQTARSLKNKDLALEVISESIK